MTPDLELASSRMADEHRQLMGLISRLEAAESDFDISSYLEELHNLLIDHFAHEQFPGGLYECMGGYGSGHHDELAILIRQHCEILSSVGGLLERAKVSDPSDREGLFTDLERVVDMLDAHERREHRLASNLMTREKDGSGTGTSRGKASSLHDSDFGDR